MYGNLGIDDPETIDAHLKRLPRNAVVVNLGCGPNVNRELHNLARALAIYQFHSTLILADLNTELIKNQCWVPGPATVQVVAVNAATATQQLGRASADLVLAFGLFGDLSASTTPRGIGKAAWPVVLSECFDLLKSTGTMIIGNSCERQPFEEFKPVVEMAGFGVSHYQESEPIHDSSVCGGRRYLAVCKRDKRAA
jgi:hypothetical protein